jgi:acetyl-CoA carboxylase biotin carboxyl carrier protein
VKIDYEAVNEFIALTKQYDLDELEVKYRDFHLTVKRRVESYLPAAAAAPQVSQTQNITTEALEFKNLTPIKAPLTGVFYRAPRPNAPPFVEIGEEVSAGQVLCIVEAMKLMNEISSEIKGKVVKIMAENGTVVKEGQVLFYLEKS